MDLYRQGDVIIKPIKTKLDFQDYSENKNLVLAEGKVTGHAHRITKGEVKLFANVIAGAMVLRVLSEYALLTHEEHENINLPTGDYEIKIQREWDWFSEEVRRVAD